MTLPPVDVVVVGAGAAGGIVAEQLALKALQVVLLERGSRQSFNQTGHDELRSQRTNVLGNAFGPDDRDYVREIVDVNGKLRSVLPSEGVTTMLPPASAEEPSATARWPGVTSSGTSR